MHPHTPQLIAQAKKRMAHSGDPYHDLQHVERVVNHAVTIGQQYALSETQMEALELAAWWHDMGRTVINKPSFIVMTLLDDLISAVMLWRETIRYRLFGQVAGLSTRLIFSKSITVGFVGKLFVGRKNQILIDILNDADKLDIINGERTRELFPIIEDSRMYNSGYRVATWWLFALGEIKLATDVGHDVLKELLEVFIIWLKEQDTYQWHVDHFSKGFIDSHIARLEKRHQLLLES